MFWKKKAVMEKPPQPKVEKLPGPKLIPGLVEKHLVAEYKMDPDLIRVLKAVVRRSPKAEKALDCRIFDEAEAAASEVQIKDYTSLDEHPELILYEGWFSEESKHVELEERKRVSYDVPLFTEAEILQKIGALSEPGSSVFFYQARGPAVGGPLGRGAAIVELNPNYPAKGKKYIIYTANVIGMEPAANKLKLYDSNKPKEIAQWIKEAHHKRTY